MQNSVFWSGYLKIQTVVNTACPHNLFPISQPLGSEILRLKKY